MRCAYTFDSTKGRFGLMGELDPVRLSDACSEQPCLTGNVRDTLTSR